MALWPVSLPPRAGLPEPGRGDGPQTRETAQLPGIPGKLAPLGRVPRKIQGLKVGMVALNQGPVGQMAMFW